eukprot:494157-Pyramimonas_sp.AAC.1
MCAPAHRETYRPPPSFPRTAVESRRNCHPDAWWACTPGGMPVPTPSLSWVPAHGADFAAM